MTAPDLKLLLMQGDTVWHDPQANRDHYQRLWAAQASEADIILLPETFTSGFSNEALADAETMQGETMAWMKHQSALHNAVIAGSVQIRDGDAVFNRMLWVEPNGCVRHYDKRHLFRMAGEHERYTAGRDKLLIDYQGWRLCLLVCYDLRFPVFSRNRFNLTRADDYDYDALIYVANWPSPRHFAWQTLLKARAIENLSYVAAVNRAGQDGNGLSYRGGSVVHDFLGATLVDAGEAPGTCTAVLSKKALTEFRARFPAHLDADAFTVQD